MYLKEEISVEVRGPAAAEFSARERDGGCQRGFNRELLAGWER